MWIHPVSWQQVRQPFHIDDPRTVEEGLPTVAPVHAQASYRPNQQSHTCPSVLPQCTAQHHTAHTPHTRPSQAMFCARNVEAFAISISKVYPTQTGKTHLEAETNKYHAARSVWFNTHRCAMRHQMNDTPMYVPNSARVARQLPPAGAATAPLAATAPAPATTAAQDQARHNAHT